MVDGAGVTGVGTASAPELNGLGVSLSIQYDKKVMATLSLKVTFNLVMSALLISIVCTKLTPRPGTLRSPVIPLL